MSLTLEEAEFGDRKVPEIYMYYLLYKKEKHVETAKHFLQWLRDHLTNLQLEYKTNGEANL
jgi:hypothetical protein